MTFPEVGGVHEDAFAVGGDDLAEGVDGLLVKAAGVDKIIDDLDLFFDVEDLVGLVAEVLGDGGDGVGLVDGEGDDGGECLVASDERDIGSVEGGDDGDAAAALCLHDLLGQIGGGGVGDRVVDMEEVEVVVGDHVDHGAGKGGFVRGVVEERIGGHADLMVEDVCVEFIEADGLLIGNKMHLVAFVRQALPNSVARTPLPPKVG